MIEKLCISYIVILQFLSCDVWMFPQSAKFTNYTEKIKAPLTGFMASFGDFNADRMVDMLILDYTNNVQHVDVLLMAKQGSEHLPKRITIFNDTYSSIRNIVTGDFNGDSMLDFMTYTSSSSTGPYSVEIVYGDILKNKPIPIYKNVSFVSQPLHLDWNADMIGDIFGQLSSTKQFVVLLGNTTRTFILRELPQLSKDINEKIDVVLFDYFVDLNQDGQPDILLIGQKGRTNIVMIGLLNVFGQFTVSNVKSFEKAEKIGHPVIADFLFDGNLQMLIPICMDSDCKTSRILACVLSNFVCSLANFNNTISTTQSATLGFQMNTPASKKLSLAIPDLVPMSCGDILMTGYISCLVTMFKTDQPLDSRLYLLFNQGGFTFSLVSFGESNLFTNVTQAAVFDFLEDGVPDIITARQQGNTGLITPILQETNGDSYFLKVFVLNGLCATADSCPEKRLPFGIPLPGINVTYLTESISGNKQTSAVSMVSSSSYTPLHLPYAFFGLSTFSNYIEKLVIQLPSQLVPRRHVLTFIVPKTQIVIIPYPLDDPSKWAFKLFLEPFADKKVLYVGAALLGTMFIVSAVLCILQYLEIREDRLEKMQEAQKFNFDAM